MSVLISGPPDAIRGSKVDVAKLHRRARRILEAIGEADSELSIALVDDPEIRELNASWRGHERATDVLSFSQIEGGFADHRGSLLGDVVISVETAAVQAAERHRALDDEVTRLLIHGVLHLIGHDHQLDSEAEAMKLEERRIWRVVTE